MTRSRPYVLLLTSPAFDNLNIAISLYLNVINKGYLFVIKINYYVLFLNEKGRTLN